MFSKPNLTKRSFTGQNCGLRYEPYKLIIKYPGNCFLNRISYLELLELNPGEYNDNIIKNRITGGEEVVDRESPWTVQIAYQVKYEIAIGRHKHYCTGVLITLKHVLTAAHCLQ